VLYVAYYNLTLQKSTFLGKKCKIYPKSYQKGLTLGIEIAYNVSTVKD